MFSRDTRACGPDSYGFSQIPVRVIFLIAATGVVLRVSWRFNRERERVEELTRHYQPLYENISDAVILTDGDHNVVDLNQSACEFLGIDSIQESQFSKLCP